MVQATVDMAEWVDIILLAPMVVLDRTVWAAWAMAAWATVGMVVWCPVSSPSGVPNLNLTFTETLFLTSVSHNNLNPQLTRLSHFFTPLSRRLAV